MLKWILVGIGGVIILIVSRKSILGPGTHGFWRFFAWETMLALFALTVEGWFRNPTSWNQILAWVLLAACLISLIFGIQSLVTRGKASTERKGDPGLIAFEKTTVLVQTGIYRYIRHPLYSSLLLLTWGMFFKQPQPLQAGLAVLGSLFILLTALADEKECMGYFGEPYRQYMQHTKRFIPFVI